MKKIIKSIFLVLVLLVTIVTVNTSTYAVTEADDVVGTTDVPAEGDSGTFTVGHTEEDGSSYKEATNSYNDGTVTYYFVTGDPAYSAKNGQNETVTYEGANYNATIIYSARKTYSKAVEGIDAVDASPIPNMYNESTYFYDEGKFVDENYEYNYNMSGDNKSVVGLYLDMNGESKTTFYKLPCPSTHSSAGFRGYKTRIMFNHPNTYIGNIVFDGSDIDMVPVGGGLSSTPKSRGEYFWILSTDTDNFVAKNVVLQNIGSNNSSDGSVFMGTARKNVALNIFTPFDGQRNFEDLTIRNCKTKAGYGVVSFNQTANNYFKNLNVENPNETGTGNAHNANSYVIKVEHSDLTKLPTGNVSDQENIVFDGTLSLPKTETVYDSVYVQDYRYQNILVPSEFTYALCQTNGNGSNSTAAIRLYDSKISAVSNHTVYELGSGYWVVEADNTNVVMNTQFTNILSLINGQKANTDIPSPNIKLIAKADGTIGGFSIPNYVAAYNNGEAYTTNIVALLQTATPADTVYPASTHASNKVGAEYVTFTPATVTDTITLPTANADKVLLFNLDFKTTSKWTIDDATGGKLVNFVKANSGRNLFLKYTVSVDFVGKEDTDIVSTQQITLNSSAVAPTDASMFLAGYTFNGWATSSSRVGPYLQKTDIDGTALADDVTYYASYTANTNTPYTIEHHLEQEDGTYRVQDTEGGTGTTGTTVTATPKTYSGYTLDTTIAGTLQSAEIAGDGKLVLKLFYTKDEEPITSDEATYKVEHYLQQEDGTFKIQETVNKKGKIGLTVTATAKGYSGYTLDTTVADTKQTGEITKDGALVLKLYYTKEKEPVAITDANYQVEHYVKQNDGTFVLKESFTFTDKVGVTVEAIPRVYDGYTIDLSVSETIKSGVVKEDGSLVLRLYYQIKSPSVVPTPNNPVKQPEEELVDLTVNANTGPNAGDSTNVYGFIVVLVASAYISIKGIKKLR
ncbi:hypothetical protein [Breznakia pachnodae]|uniref:Repeat protein (TIGR02543 family) n=1 Tax=Breznakia pachnodae TaxID=265178 RepID=A0ABU0DYZ0_9FIRM|nr:hypothetical protein [Breznakia pachnodae]MDQ0359851.1 putative repeat protein (TIGR02543 family) [Breznakia pachnodae]